MLNPPQTKELAQSVGSSIFASMNDLPLAATSAIQ
jgi:hypothetical protein